MRRIATALILTAALASACSSIDCPVQNTVATEYGLYKSDGTADTLRYDTLTIASTRRDGNDTTLLNRGTGIIGFTLPISNGAATDTLFFELKDTLSTVRRDTLYVDKEDFPHFESVDCNMSYFHTLTGIRWTTNAIDSVIIKNRNVNYDASTQHIHLYLKPRD